MKIGISVWAFPKEWDLLEIFDTAASAGFDGVELALSENGEVNLDCSEEDMQAVKKLAIEHGLELYSLASGLYWQYSLTSNDQATAEKAKSIVRKQLDVASWLGCDTILVVPGSVGVDFIPGCEIVEYDTAYDRALTALNQLKEYARQCGVTIGIENVWNKFLLSPLEMRDFIDKLDSKHVGAYFDVGNVIYSGYPEHWIKILNERIKKVHFKDFRRSIGSIDGFVDLLSGDVDFPAVMTALDKIGYTGWVTAEVGFSKHYPKQSVRNVSGAMKKIIGRE